MDTCVSVPAVGEENFPVDKVFPQASYRRKTEDVAQFTSQQFRLMKYIPIGLSNKQIAYELDITEATIKVHLKILFKKMGVVNRVQAAIWIRENGLG